MSPAKCHHQPYLKQRMLKHRPQSEYSRVSISFRVLRLHSRAGTQLLLALNGYEDISSRQVQVPTCTTSEITSQVQKTIVYIRADSKLDLRPITTMNLQMKDSLRDDSRKKPILLAWQEIQVTTMDKSADNYELDARPTRGGTA